MQGMTVGIRDIMSGKTKNAPAIVSALSIDKESPLPIHVQLTEAFRRILK